ncbi:MAG: DNA internalization-related competence protein ComEC/Rec2 [Bacilli bacterium]|jgi:competence protein ComEC
MIACLILLSLVFGMWCIHLSWIVLIPLLALGLFLSFHRFRGRGILIFSVCVAIGLGVSFLDRIEPRPQASYQGIVVSSKDNYFILRSGGHKYYVEEEDNERELGDYLRLKGTLSKLSFQTYESRFDFQKYLNDKGVFYQIKASAAEVVFAAPLRLNARKDRFLMDFDGEAKTLIDALLFSRKDYESEIISQADHLNLLFLFAMSGIYVRLILSLFEYLLRLKLSDHTSRLLALLFMVPLLLFSLERIGVLRVFIAYLLRLINDRFLKSRFTYLGILSLIAFSFLACDFHAAYQMSFLLSFGISFLIVFTRSAINVFRRKKRRVITGLTVFLFLIPIQVSLAYEFHLLQLLFQMIALPFHVVFFFLAMIAFYGLPLISVLVFFTKSFDIIYTFLHSIDLVIIVGQPSDFFYLLYYSLYFYMAYLLEGHRLMDAKKVGLALASALVVSSIPFQHISAQAIHFINVGQGDAILIENRGRNVLIDTGGNMSFDMAEEVLIPFFKKHQIYHIDVLITTHHDQDHDGAVNSLIANYEVGEHVTSRNRFPIQCGDLSIENLNLLLHDDDNDNSLVLTFDFLEATWLLMGDASKNVEREIIASHPQLDVDYLKIGHHGSKTATSEEFVRAVAPEVAIISVGMHNFYGHPDDEVLKLLAKCGVEIRRTDYEGTISFNSDLF